MIITRLFFGLLCVAMPLAAAAEDYLHRVVPGDTLIGVAGRLLAVPADWPRLQKLNRVRDPHRLQPGSTLRIPVELMRGVPMQATVVQVQGGANVEQGAVLAERAVVRTSEDGTVTLRFGDGSLALVQSASELRLDTLRDYPGTEMQQTSMHLLRGRIESLVERLRGSGRHEVHTPSGNAVVRGTRFRVASDVQSGAQRSEVIEGAVEVDGRADPARPVKVGAGFGAVVEADGRVTEPVVLLAPPDVSALPALMERTLLRFSFPPLAGALRYRAQVATDSDFRRVVAQTVDTQIRFANIADGAYFLRVRGIDARGLEGVDADRAFRLKARPEPPFASQPAPRGKSAGTGATFAWAENADASHYRFQLARDAAFRQMVVEEAAVKASKLEIAALTPGEYYWRLASVRASGDQGPFGDALQFTQKPLPAAADPARISEDSIKFSWAGEPQQTFEFQLSRDAAFTKLVESRELKQGRIEITRPGPGQYFMRYRARDPDGYVGPYSTPQRFELPNCIMDGSGNCVKGNYDSHIGRQ